MFPNLELSVSIFIASAGFLLATTLYTIYKTNRTPPTIASIITA